ncbi:MAG TPA: DUF1800 domain-containing protein [Oculatellaceae cyanobacterium]
MKKIRSLVSLLSLTVVLGSCGFNALAASAPPVENTEYNAIHVLDRLSFGPSPGDIAHVQKVGIQQYIDEQLNPANLPDPVDVNSPDFKNLNANATDLLTEFRQFAKDRKEMKAQGKDEEFKGVQMKFYASTDLQFNKARLMRAIKSPRQLEEVMTEFWYNHFNVFDKKEADRALIGCYEQQAIRPYALTNFKQLVTATCHHPAMLYYLDNWRNAAPGTPGARGQFKGLNENYARELMELHTLGVDGGYSQNDVIQLAHVLTGLGIQGANANQNNQATPVDKYGAVFFANRHDPGDKTILGHVIKGRGEEEIEEAIDILVKHPSTAHHIAFQLAQYFVADNPPPALVDRLANEFKKSDGDIKTVLKALFASAEFWSPQNENNKFKSPFRYIVSCFRAAGTEPVRYEFISAQLRNQGEPMYGCLTPDGYKNVETAWLSPDALLKRIGFATQLASGRLGGAQSDPLEFKSLYDTLGGDTFFKDSGPKIAAEPEKLKPALLLGSPEFMRY